jgi:excisionase family DNA binding protein
MTAPEVPRPGLRSVTGSAEYLAISRAKLYELIFSGELASLKIGSRRLISTAELDRFIAAKQAESGGA